VISGGDIPSSRDRLSRLVLSPVVADVDRVASGVCHGAGERLEIELGGTKAVLVRALRRELTHHPG
jgi:hypothetical protein